ncbi:MAG: adenylosuccinate lyase, partial [Flavobacteriaceae bacterium]
AFEMNDPLSSRACRVLEIITKERLDCLLPYLDDFVSKLGQFRLDSSIRPMAKICEKLTESYFSKSVNETQKVVTELHLEQITAACFDWLISPQKVAVQVYAMSSLWWIGHKVHWIHPELKLILEQGYPIGSAAFKARARHILSNLGNKGE